MKGLRSVDTVCAVCSGTGSEPHSSDRWNRMPCIEGNTLEVEEVWHEVEQAPYTLHVLRTARLYSDTILHT